MSVRVRFAPSPTGQVHIGNIRAAIFNWLFARHEGGSFLLRIEDTDQQRSTPEAIATLLEVMQWLGLDFDEEALYQSSQRQKHLQAAEKLRSLGHVYSDGPDAASQAMVFRIPWQAEELCEGIQEQGAMRMKIHPEQPVQISHKGLRFAAVSKKGAAVPDSACLAGFKNLQVYDSEGRQIFVLQEHIEEILRDGRQFSLENAAELRFTRRSISYVDQVKGEMSKPLDSMRDLVIVRGDGSPVFHLANVVDDISQAVTHIIRGDDHVENSFRHLLLFACLGAKPPVYAHLPMIVNAAGKPYSKRDGDAFVGEFRDKGFLPHTLFNYLSLLGWSPGDDREKMSREELVQAFSLQRCLHSSAQLDIVKMDALNALYIAEMEPGEFVAQCREFVQHLPWGKELDEDYFAKVCAFMQSRLKRFVDVEQWQYFFGEDYQRDEKFCGKQLSDDNTLAALKALQEKLAALPEFSAANIEASIHEASDEFNIRRGRLNQPIRAAVTGIGTGAGIYETLELLGKEKSIARLNLSAK
jgi:glutamyl-tRNA synthetase